MVNSLQVDNTKKERLIEREKVRMNEKKEEAKKIKKTSCTSTKEIG